MKKIISEGNISADNLKINDIIYEFQFGFCIKSIIITEPKWLDKNIFIFTSRNLNTEELIFYEIDIRYIQQLPEIYDYKRYQNIEEI